MTFKKGHRPHNKGKHLPLEQKMALRDKWYDREQKKQEREYIFINNLLNAKDAFLVMIFAISLIGITIMFTTTDPSIFIFGAIVEIFAYFPADRYEKIVAVIEKYVK